MRDMGSKTFGIYDEFKGAFTSFETVINDDDKATV